MNQAEQQGKFQNRIVLVMDMADYLESPGVSKTHLDAIDESPAQYRDLIDGKVQPETEPHFELGKALHSLVLENKTIHRVKPATYVNSDGDEKPWNGNSNTCKQWLRDNAGSIVLDQDQDRWLKKAQALVLADSRCSQVLIRGVPELSMFGFDAKYNLALKTRPDWASVESGVFVNVKSTASASTANLSRQINKLRWHVQAAMVRRVARINGYKCDEYYIIAVQKSDPPRLNVRRLETTAIDRGEELLERNLKTLCQCALEDSWPDYSGAGTGIGTIDIPAWAYNDAEPIGLKIGELHYAL